MARKTTRKAATRPRKTAARKMRSVPATELPLGLNPMLLEAMSLRVPTRSGAERRLTGAEVERALISGEHAQTLELYFGEAEYAELRSLGRLRCALGSRRLRFRGLLHRFATLLPSEIILIRSCRSVANSGSQCSRRRLRS